MLHASAPSSTLPAEPFRLQVEQELVRFLSEERRRMSDEAAAGVALLDELQRMIEGGGKRLRPLFCYWGYRAGGGQEDPEIVRAGAAVELLHMSALIHDDLMDRSHLRRGRTTSFRELAGPDPDDKASARFGRSAAILAGDLAQALADQLLAGAAFPPERLLVAFAFFNRMRVEAVTGEFLDLRRARLGEVDESGARRVAALKSGSYTVVGPLLMGCALAGGETGVGEALAEYGRPLGEAFQLRDDVLGTFGDPSLTGKERDTDIREGKRTVLVAKAWDLGTPETRSLLAEWLGRSELTSSQVQDVREVLRTSGALAETLELIDALAGRAKAALEGASLPGEAGRALADLADLVALRDA